MATKGQLKQQIQRLHVATAVVFAALAVAAGVMMKATSYPFVVSHETKDELASQTSTVFAPAVHHIIDIDMRWALIALMVVGVITAVLALTYWQKEYAKQIDKRLSPLTWISMGGINVSSVSSAPSFMIVQVNWLFRICSISIYRSRYSIVLRSETNDCAE